MDQAGQNKGTSAVPPAVIETQTVVLDHLLAEGILQVVDQPSKCSFKVVLHQSFGKRMADCCRRTYSCPSSAVMADNAAD
jgi:hypothetical protein